MNQTSPTMHQVIEEMEVYLNETEIKYQIIQNNSDRIYKRTTRIIKTVFSLIGLLLLINIYFIYNFGEGIVSMLSSMNEMYTHFGNMGNQVSGITESVVKMTAHITVLPDMAESMDSITNTVVNMNTNVHSMQGEVSYMAIDMGSINNDMSDMTNRFELLNESMTHMGSSVHDMSRIIPQI